MIEELFVIKDGVRHKVDLATPSGITLSFKSPLLNDLSSFECSRSYTFNLPLTANNTAVFDMLNDVRCSESSLGQKYKAEYIIDGLPIVTNGNIYVAEVSGTFAAVMTWNVVEDMKVLQESKLNINDLYKQEMQHKEGVTIPEEDGQFIGIVDFNEIEDNPNEI